MIRSCFVSTAAAALAVTSLVSASPGWGQEAASYVFTNGKVYTVDEQQPWAEAVAVKDN